MVEATVSCKSPFFHCSCGFNKREGKASENSVLTSRVIDRPMRPLFPKDYRNEVTISNMVMSVDPDCRPEITAMLGSAIVASIQKSRQTLHQKDG